MNPLNIICYLKFIEEGKNYVFVQKLNSNILENLKLEFHRQRVLVDEWCLSLTYKPNSTYVIVGSCPNTKLSAKVPTHLTKICFYRKTVRAFLPY